MLFYLVRLGTDNLKYQPGTVHLDRWIMQTIERYHFSKATLFLGYGTVQCRSHYMSFVEFGGKHKLFWIKSDEQPDFTKTINKMMQGMLLVIWDGGVIVGSPQGARQYQPCMPM